MLGFGLSDLAVIRPCPDLLSPAVVRASQGAIFQLRWSCFGTFQDYRMRFADRQFYCLTVDGDRRIEHLMPRDRFALVFGEEGPGLGPEVRRRGTTVRIDHHPRIDSLNLGVAAGIVFHQVAGVAAAENPQRKDG
jgi:TrmH family RNA methyltransferase